MNRRNINLEKDNETGVRKYQAKLLISQKRDVSFNEALNDVLRKGLAVLSTEEKERVRPETWCKSCGHPGSWHPDYGPCELYDTRYGPVPPSAVPCGCNGYYPGKRGGSTS